MADMDLISFVSEEIAYYLTQEKLAAIPGLGRFASAYQAAHLDQTSGVLIASHLSISFSANPEETNSDFADYLTDHHTEENLIQDFASACLDRLTKEGSVALSELGLCTQEGAGTIHFENQAQLENDNGFSMPDIKLYPIIPIEEILEAGPINSPGASAVAEPKPSNRRALIRIGMVISSIVLLVTLVSRFQFSQSEDNAFQKVSTNYNVSPKDLQSEVLTAATNEMEQTIDLTDSTEDIIEKQNLMTADGVSTLTAQIITNTFGNSDNVNRQLELISSLGYEGTALVKENGLVSTLIAIDYATPNELEAKLEEVKKEFPRAKIKK